MALRPNLLLTVYRNTLYLGNFHFKLCYPELGDNHCNEWTQSSNPVTKGTIRGFQAISLTFRKNGNGGDWGGLGKSDTDHTLIDDTGSADSWWCAIGAMKFYKDEMGKIPGPWNERVKRIELYVYTGKYQLRTLK